MNLKFKRVMVTGAAGFIGFHLAQRLLKDGCHVTGIDNLNTYYDVRLKEARLEILKGQENFTFFKMDLCDRKDFEKNLENSSFDVVVNLAAQAGVRYSLENPHAYVDANLAGFVNILEYCRHSDVKHLVFASSSSVYGANTKMPFSVHDNIDHPVSLYAATKKANELMAHTYSHLYGLHCTGLRFFTVYGPWGRPDIIEGVARVMGKLPEPNPAWSGDNPDPGTSYTNYKIYNIGNNNPVELMEFIETIEKVLGKEATKEFMDLQPGDVPATYADIDDLINDVGFKPATSIEQGIKRFISWYREYYE